MNNEQGTATLIAVLILALLSMFVALALSRVTTEAIVMNNDSLNSRAYYAAQASLELMTRNFGKLFNATVNPSAADITAKVMNVTPANFGGTITDVAGNPVAYNNFSDYEFDQQILVAGTALTDQPIGGGDFAGLSAERSPYRMVTTARHIPTDASVTLTRNFISNVIPIFQFGIFYDHELEFYSGTNFNFGGRVHTNDDIYLLGGTDNPLKETIFSDKVSAVGHIVNDVTRNGLAWTQFGGIQDNIKIYNDASPIATPVPFDHDATSAVKGTVVGGPDTTGAGTEKPTGTSVANWDGLYAVRFGENLKKLTKPLRLPINAGGSRNNIELIKRGRSAGEYETERLGRIADNVRPGLAGARYFNKPGIRISLADSRSKLPGCYDASQPDLGKAVNPSDPRPCGIRLDGAGDGRGGDSGKRVDPTGVNPGLVNDGSRGYEPLPMNGGAYQAKRVNGYRFYSGPSYPVGVNGTPSLPDIYPVRNRQTWIKVETVPQAGGAPQDITEEILSLGLTHLDTTGLNIGDARAIVKMQRYEIKGNALYNSTPTLVPTARLRRIDKSTCLRHSDSVNPCSSNPASDDPFVPLGGPLGLTSPINYAVVWEGQILAQATADHRFKVESRNGVRLWVNGQQLLDDSFWVDGTAVTVKTGTSTVPLQAGRWYDIRMEAYNVSSATSGIQLRWERVGSPGSEQPIRSSLLRTPEKVPGGLRADYFSDPSPTEVKNLVARQAAYFDPSTNQSFVRAGIDHTAVVTHTGISSDLGLTAQTEAQAQAATAVVGTNTYSVVPVPIQMFDSREGVSHMDYSEASLNTLYDGGRSVPWNGVMSMVDIDMGNLSSFLRGDFNGGFPTNTTYYKNNGAAFTASNTTVPNSRGRLVYISDRRGDYDFDGEFDMEDIYGPKASGNDNTQQSGEDANGDNVLQNDYEWEGAKYLPDNSGAVGAWKTATLPFPPGPERTAATYRDLAAVFDHRFYRRGVRLINGQSLFGTFQEGLTVASENGVYIKGNYNATGIASASAPTPSRDFCPNSDPNLPGGGSAPTACTERVGQVPASVVGDAITILSNNWRDGNSFASPFQVGDGTDERRLATETTVRAAMIAGDTISSLYFDASGTPINASAPSQGGGVFQRLNGGVANYLRMLEWWKTGNLNYAGSLINLYHSRNNTGSFKFGNSGGNTFIVYRAPGRNWTFDASFTNPTRLPPATPVVQHTQTTGFRVVTE